MLRSGVMFAVGFVGCQLLFRVNSVGCYVSLLFVLFGCFVISSLFVLGS